VIGALGALAPGKVNLCLLVGGPRADGLHPIVSEMQPVSLADELRLEPAPAGAAGDEVVCPGVPGENLAARALALYREATGWDAPPLRLTIRKRVPVAAGMGGGSADAAAALRLAAAAAGRPGDPLLAALAPRLGSDVPAQLAARRVLVTGAGEHVEPLPGPAPCGLLILPSDRRLGAAEVYREHDGLGPGRGHEELARLHEQAAAVLRRGGTLPAELRVNDLERAARSLCPSIAEGLDAARAAGAEAAFVTGSGPTVVGIFDGLDRAGEAAAVLRPAYPGAVAAAPVGESFAAVREAATPR
jgi:4-diphosphocytidyl-2-C-methyl-D-erythritol kinase